MNRLIGTLCVYFVTENDRSKYTIGITLLTRCTECGSNSLHPANHATTALQSVPNHPLSHWTPVRIQRFAYCSRAANSHVQSPIATQAMGMGARVSQGIGISPPEYKRGLLSRYRDHESAAIAAFSHRVSSNVLLTPNRAHTSACTRGSSCSCNSHEAISFVRTQGLASRSGWTLVWTSTLNFSNATLNPLVDIKPTQYIFFTVSKSFAIASRTDRYLPNFCCTGPPQPSIKSASHNASHWYTLLVIGDRAWISVPPQSL